MDKIWLDNGLDLRMSPYIVQSTKDQVGMIEIVVQSETTEHIQNTYGGALGALKKSTIIQYIKKHCPNKEHLPIAIDNFLRSCAGYCVATFILGIGDRHSGNIMVKKSGHLFHIDFGHFLGNFKSKYGVKRERNKFVFTPEMAEVMGGKSSPHFTTF